MRRPFESQRWRDGTKPLWGEVERDSYAEVNRPLQSSFGMA